MPLLPMRECLCCRVCLLYETFIKMRKTHLHVSAFQLAVYGKTHFRYEFANGRSANSEEILQACVSLSCKKYT